MYHSFYMLLQYHSTSPKYKIPWNFVHLSKSTTCTVLPWFSVPIYHGTIPKYHSVMSNKLVCTTLFVSVIVQYNCRGKIVLFLELSWSTIINTIVQEFQFVQVSTKWVHKNNSNLSTTFQCWVVIVDSRSVIAMRYRMTVGKKKDPDVRSCKWNFISELKGMSGYVSPQS